MKKPFQVGDKVRCYGYDKRGKIIDCKRGKVACFADFSTEDTCGSSGVYVEFDDENERTLFHVKQLRRLVPKKRREIWVTDHDGNLGSEACVTPALAACFIESSADPSVVVRARVVKFREVFEK